MIIIIPACIVIHAVYIISKACMFHVAIRTIILGIHFDHEAFFVILHAECIGVSTIIHVRKIIRLIQKKGKTIATDFSGEFFTPCLFGVDTGIRK